jgi:hypothetical protein
MTDPAWRSARDGSFMGQSGRKRRQPLAKRNGSKTRLATCEPLLTVATSCDHLWMVKRGSIRARNAVSRTDPDLFAGRATLHPAHIPHEAPGDPRPHPENTRNGKVGKACSRGEIDAILVQAGSAKTGLSRRSHGFESRRFRLRNACKGSSRVVSVGGKSVIEHNRSLPATGNRS